MSTVSTLKRVVCHVKRPSDLDGEIVGSKVDLLGVKSVFISLDLLHLWIPETLVAFYRLGAN